MNSVNFSYTVFALKFFAGLLLKQWSNCNPCFFCSSSSGLSFQMNIFWCVYSLSKHDRSLDLSQISVHLNPITDRYTQHVFSCLFFKVVVRPHLLIVEIKLKRPSATPPFCLIVFSESEFNPLSEGSALSILTWVPAVKKQTHSALWLQVQWRKESTISSQLRGFWPLLNKHVSVDVWYTRWYMHCVHNLMMTSFFLPILNQCVNMYKEITKCSYCRLQWNRKNNTGACSE